MISRYEDYLNTLRARVTEAKRRVIDEEDHFRVIEGVVSRHLANQEPSSMHGLNRATAGLEHTVYERMYGLSVVEDSVGSALIRIIESSYNGEDINLIEADAKRCHWCSYMLRQIQQRQMTKQMYESLLGRSVYKTDLGLPPSKDKVQSNILNEWTKLLISSRTKE